MKAVKERRVGEDEGSKRKDALDYLDVLLQELVYFIGNLQLNTIEDYCWRLI